MAALTCGLNTIPSEKLVSVDIGFFIGMPKSWSKKKKELKNGQYCDNTADVDNYLKAILDSLNGVLFIDDKQVVEIFARKIYSETGYILYKQKELDNGINKVGIM